MATAIAVLFTSGCATIINGSKQEISISSTPAAAKVIIDGSEAGVTPLITKLTRKDTHLVKITLDGYLPYETAFTRKVDGWIAGNILFGGLIGLAIDAITGGMYKLRPDQINAVLRNGNASFLQKKNDLYCIIVLKADPDWQKVGQLTSSHP